MMQNISAERQVCSRLDFAEPTMFMDPRRCANDEVAARRLDVGMPNYVLVPSVVETDLDTIHVMDGCATNIPRVLLPALNEFRSRHDVVVDQTLNLSDIVEVWSSVLEQVPNGVTGRVRFLDDSAQPTDGRFPVRSH